MKKEEVVGETKNYLEIASKMFPYSEIDIGRLVMDEDKLEEIYMKVADYIADSVVFIISNFLNKIDKILGVK